MNKEQLIHHINEGNFNIPTGRNESQLITDNKHFPGISLYPREFNGSTTYTAVFGNELPRLGINALVNIDDSWYILPVVGDVDLLKELRPVYSKCMLLTGFADNDVDANKLVTILTSLSTPFGFSGTIEKKLNKQTSRFPVSYTVKLNKNTPFKPDLDASIQLVSDITWE